MACRKACQCTMPSSTLVQRPQVRRTKNVGEVRVRVMAKLIVSGAGGRMGRLLVSMIAADPQHTLAGALEAEAAGVTGRDAGEVAGAGRLGVAISTDYSTIARPNTVTLDFTSAAASLRHLEVAA